MDENVKAKMRNIKEFIALEKFKRRLIRAVSRMLLLEKRNEDEVWAGLKQETGCDCKLLWNRMHALTMKKLKRLLDAQDRDDLLPKAARMSETDWFLFDHVIVHEDFDVIGLTETTGTDRAVLVDLFYLVEKYKIDFRAGDNLAEAWSLLTAEYNKENRRCSPMLLQRRWYQLKLATRGRFYKFWCSYKGQIKRLPLAQPYRPTPLQIEIARAYKTIVVSRFVSWEELLEHKLVVRPEEFEPKHLRQTSDNDPDVMCVESKVETIELDEDSDIEIEYRKEEDKNTEETPVVKVKEEPKDFDEMDDADENVPCQNRQEKRSEFADAVMEATAQELDEMELEEDIHMLIESKSGDSPDEDVSGEDNNKEINEKSIASEDVCSTNIASADDDVIPVPEEKSTEYQTAEENNQESVDLETNANISEPEEMLPKITSIFGGVDESNETLSKIAMLTAEISKPKTLVENTVITQENKNDEAIELSSDEIEDSTDCLPVKVKEEVDIKPNINSNWFGELSDDIVFADDGIQLLDDGIACQDDEYEYKIDIKKEVKLEGDDEERGGTSTEEDGDDTPKVDKKLLMLPVVSTIKLDDMGILPINLLQHVDNKTIIDMIHFKSKLIEKKDTTYSSTDSSEEEVVKDIKKVKLSSILLQKPRSRTYNPIQLCKNPDFNTRLKRLTVGFFSSSRNRYLLKSCNPVTIDVSKAFENRLVNGTMYLKASDNEELSKNDNPKESKTVSITPSAMPVQSLINNINVTNSVDNTQPAFCPLTPNPIESLACERNKVINLPDISEIRRINQKLLTAQVTPLQLKNDCLDVPVNILPGESFMDSNTNTANMKVAGRHIAGPASRTKVPQLTVVDITKEDTANSAADTLAPNTFKQKDTWRKGDKIIPWKPRQIRPDIPWFIKINNIQDSDALLALDTLNKMLYLLSDESNAELLSKKKKWQWKQILAKEERKENKDGRDIAKGRKRKKVLPDNLPSETNKVIIDDDDNDDVQVISEPNPPESSEATKITKDVTKTDASNKQACCWARERIIQLMNPKKRPRNHFCAFPLCVCCCKQDLADHFKKQKTQAILKYKQQNKLDIRIENVVSGTEADIITTVQQAGDSASPSLHIEDSTQAEITNQKPTLSEKVECDKVSSVAPCSESVIQNDDPFKSDNRVTKEVSPQFDDVSQIDNHMGMEIVIEASESPKQNLEIDDTESADTRSADLQTFDKKTPRFRVSHARYKNAPKTRILKTRLRGKSVPENQVKVTTGPKIDTHTTNLCNPERPELPFYTLLTDSVNKKITIDNGIPNLLPMQAPKRPPPPKTYKNHKLVYLNRKLSDSSPDNPIFLGKNKILLTTAKFPPNFKAFEELNRCLKQSQVIPKYIQLILQPNGKLTYIRLNRMVPDRTFMEALPLLIMSLQQYLDASVPGGMETPVVTTNAENEVIDLSDDETSKKEQINDESHEPPKETENEAPSVTDKSSETIQELNNLDVTDQNDDLVSVHIECNDVIQNEGAETNKIDNQEISEIDSLSTENSINAVNSISDLTLINSTNNFNPEENVIPKADDSISTDATNIAVTPIDVTTEEINVNIASQETEISSNQNTENENATATSMNEIPETGKTKNILSDLMAMSGIGPIDVAPTPQQVPTESSSDIIIPQQMPDESVPSVSALNPPPLVNIDETKNTTPPSNHSLLLESLTAITSLSELKYACTQSGSFFKLDFDTGFLVPINVCMKKLTETSQERHNSRKTRHNSESPSKPVIDLTDDDICEVTDVVQPTSVNERSLLKTSVLSDTNKSAKDKLYCKETIKPLKLFKSTPSVGKQKILKINAVGNTTEPDSNMAVTTDKQSDEAQLLRGTIKNISSCHAGIVKPLKLFKITSKASSPNTLLQKKLKEIHKKISDAMSAQDLIRRKLKRKQELRELRVDDDLITQEIKSSSDCSSDEEPLSKVAKKMRALEKENAKSHTDVNEKLNEDNIPEDTVMDSGVMPTDEGREDEFVSESNIEPVDEEMTLEVLDEAALDADEEDCILGF